MHINPSAKSLLSLQGKEHYCTSNQGSRKKVFFLMDRPLRPYLKDRELNRNEDTFEGKKNMTTSRKSRKENQYTSDNITSEGCI